MEIWVAHIYAAFTELIRHCSEMQMRLNFVKSPDGWGTLLCITTCYGHMPFLLALVRDLQVVCVFIPLSVLVNLQAAVFRSGAHWLLCAGTFGVVLQKLSLSCCSDTLATLSWVQATFLQDAVRIGFTQRRTFCIIACGGSSGHVANRVGGLLSDLPEGKHGAPGRELDGKCST